MAMVVMAGESLRMVMTHWRGVMCVLWRDDGRVAVAVRSV